MGTQQRPRLLTVTEAAAQLRVHPNRVYEFIYAGQLASTRLPGQGTRPGPWRIEQAEVDAFIKRHRTARAAS